jgi:hypothetical protein
VGKLIRSKVSSILFIVTFPFYYSCGQPVAALGDVDCDIHGSAHPGRPEYRLNEYKNRFAFPRKEDYLPNITIEQLAAGRDESEFPMDKAVILTGYVFSVKMGGVETCNCKTKDEAFRDTHIELTPDEQHTSEEYRLIVEVTPRLRGLMAAKGVDWSTEALKATLPGHRVKISGWLFYDEEHKSQAFATNPGGERNWRASCWEVHPVTYIKVLD